MKKCWMYVWAMASFFALAPLAMADIQGGEGYFGNTYLLDFKYRVENGRVKIDSISWDYIPRDPYPCRALMIQSRLAGTFQSCTLSRFIKGAETERTYTRVTDLTQAQLVAFLQTTGDVGVATNDRHTYFALGVNTSLGFAASYIPRDYNSESGMIPPVEPPPPALSCSITTGTIDHGQLASTSVNGRSANTPLFVDCNGTTNVQVRALSDDMTLTNGTETLKSLITIDGKSAVLGVVKRVANSGSFTINSELRSAATEIAGGVYGGTLIILVDTI
ncbi:MrpH family fimbial adhesin [Serratia liquefaciens]|uniref:MrpH family fimbial adhesin n=1 Tax=Serratia liquefaciens TaxID=614 RepID=UPI0021774015|nr:hypothetical protein [Serratia liquefaciens]CAI1195241.1 Uncharacterised protein [Serratia liquefaciens]